MFISSSCSGFATCLINTQLCSESVKRECHWSNWESTWYFWNKFLVNRIIWRIALTDRKCVYDNIQKLKCYVTRYVNFKKVFSFTCDSCQLQHTPCHFTLLSTSTIDRLNREKPMHWCP